MRRLLKHETHWCLRCRGSVLLSPAGLKAQPRLHDGNPTSACCLGRCKIWSDIYPLWSYAQHKSALIISAIFRIPYAARCCPVVPRTTARSFFLALPYRLHSFPISISTGLRPTSPESATIRGNIIWQPGVCWLTACACAMVEPSSLGMRVQATISSAATSSIRDRRCKHCAPIRDSCEG